MRFYFWTIVLFAFVWEVYSLLPPHYDRLHARAGLHYVEGVIHSHSIFSDGSGTVPEMAKAAAQAGMDFMILTDHNSSEARRKGFERRYGDVDVFVEMEASTPAGHALTFFSQTPARHLDDATVARLSWDHFLGKETPPGMFIAIAHPSNIRNPWNRLDRFPEGIEVLNFDSMWQRELSDSLLAFASTTFLYPFNNYLAALRFFQIYRKDFIAWDAMNAVSHGHFGIVGQDTHAKLELDKRWSLAWPSYLQTFRLANNVLFYDLPLATDFEARKKQLYQSLRSGRAALILQAIHPFAGNDWRVECNGKTYRSGNEFPIQKGKCDFVISTPDDIPYPIHLELWKDGELFRTVNQAASEVRIPAEDPGVYRLEVWLHPHTIFHLLLDREVPYLFYNPIYAL